MISTKIISDLQHGEELLSKAKLTLSWDGTSVKGAHLKEIHVTTSNKEIHVTTSNKEIT